MSSPKVFLKKEPFPHAIIEDFYTNDELSLIWKELDFLTSPNKLIKSGKEIGTAKDKISSNIKSDSLGLNLDDIYKDRKYSDILSITDKIYNPNLLDAISQLSPLFGHVRNLNYSNTKIKYYEDYEGYQSHIDTARFTAISYFIKDSKAFDGGELYFKDFDYTFIPKNNSFIFFCGAIEHEVKKVIFKEFDKKLSGKGRYSITKFMDIREC